ncbi:MAG: polymer-forming cytoskeletal protein [Desulfopila sp.]|jgi:cytoskeletal protein CcmA (bactofilin family)|nr:polymer-forming cytoskeletal protein [Desulfopila sp.]
MFGKKEDIEKEIEKVESEAISSIIDASMTLTGEMSFKGKTRIDGQINGNIKGEHLILSKDGKINGDVIVSSFICQGNFTGNIEAKILTARKGSSIQGKIVAGSLTVEPGARLDGEIKAATKDTDSSLKSGSTTKSLPPNSLPEGTTKKL